MSPSSEVLPLKPESPVNTRIRRVVAFIFLLGVFFPFVRVTPLETDVQPLALVFSVLFILCVKNWRLPVSVSLLFVPVFFLPLILWLGGFNFDGVRGAMSYISLFCISAASYFLIRDRIVWSERFLKSIICIWCGVALIQILGDREFLSFLLPRVSTTAGRGVVSLAPEPTFYGIIILFFGFFLFVEKKLSWFWTLVILGQILILARSSMVALFLLILGSVYLFFSLSLRLLVWTTLLLGSGIWILFTFYEQELTGSRLYMLFQLALKSPILIVTQDESGNDRFLHIFFSVLGFFDNYGLPHGFSRFVQYMSEKMGEYHALVLNLTKGDRIMSGYGAALFEMGFIGLFIPVAVGLTLWQYFHQSRRLRVTFVVFFSIIMFSAIQLSFPPLGFMVGYLAAKTVMENEGHHV